MNDASQAPGPIPGPGGNKGQEALASGEMGGSTASANTGANQAPVTGRHKAGEGENSLTKKATDMGPKIIGHGVPDTSKTLERMLSAPKKLRQEALVAAEAALNDELDVLLATQAKAAKILGCSRFTIRNMVLDGTLHPVNIRGALRYRISELRHLAEHGSGNQPVKRRPGSRIKGNHEPDDGLDEPTPGVPRPKA